jgi:hypothetical protein
MADTASTTFPKSTPIPERSSRTYTATLSDMDGIALEPAQVSSIRFSLRADASDAVVNNRYRVQVLNANGGTMSTGGAFKMVFTPEDMVALGGSKLQKRRAVFEVDYTTGHENHEVFFYVENLEDIPQTNLGDHELLHLAESVSAALA